MQFQHRFRARAAVRLMGALAMTLAAHAQVAPLIPPPLAPVDLSPAAGDYQGRTGHATPVTMGWTQAFPTGMTLNPLATHFVVCLDAYAGASAPACTVASADWTEAISAPSGLLARTGNRFTLTPGRFIEDTELDTGMRLTVGACSQRVTRSCRFTGVDLYYSSRNIVADGASENGLSTNSTWIFDMRATNPGDGWVAGFDGTLQLFEVLSTGTDGRDCRRDVDLSDVAHDPTLIVIAKDGSMKPIQMVTRVGGRYSGPPVAGIFRVGNFSDSRSFTTGNPSLGPNVVSSRGVAVVDFPITAGIVQQRTFVALELLDTGNAVREFNETDNAIAQCRRR